MCKIKSTCRRRAQAHQATGAWTQVKSRFPKPNTEHILCLAIETLQTFQEKRSVPLVLYSVSKRKTKIHGKPTWTSKIKFIYRFFD
jgi:hypothetical protein